ncbi:putative pectin lyase [Aureobasidium pullulans]|uniref:pectin lyase n=1 Tax=Aureobasidium pullulans TaxID=5580 RepID=A0A4T0ETQ0_AURPU|nr:putative pectin lyase [Aureobasidium pullulans]TIA77879.1 putative pectin lyase [Aureobasidium pullulans]
MKSFTLFTSALAAFASTVSAAGVTGAAEGFAKGVTGGGSAAPVYPSTTAELVSYLGDSSPRVIILTKTFDFRNTEGTTSAKGCSPWGTGSLCQQAIDKDNWCENYESSSPKVSSLTYDKAGMIGITVNSNKSLVGQGSKGIIKGKGLRLANGVKNIIIQNLAITDINPHYVWGGDAITLAGTDMIWIDHVTTQRIARQHIVLGESASGRVTISNCDIDGASSWSATCDGRHYWALYFTGSSDMITLKGNYIHHTSGRSPKVQGNTLLHAVNNYWYDIDSKGHAFELGQGGYVLAEGNKFQNVNTIIEAGATGKYFTVPSSGSACSSVLGRSCVNNAFGSSGLFSSADTSFLSNFKGKNIASAAAASTVSTANVGYGKI